MSDRNILCPTDFSEPADLAMDYALQTARRSGAKLHLLHVVEPAGVPVGFAPGAGAGAQAPRAARATGTGPDEPSRQCPGRHAGWGTVDD